MHKFNLDFKFFKGKDNMLANCFVSFPCLNKASDGDGTKQIQKQHRSNEGTIDLFQSH